MQRPLIFLNVEQFAPEIKQLKNDGMVPIGNIDIFRKQVETMTGYPIDRMHFFRMIMEEMAYRYMENLEE